MPTSSSSSSSSSSVQSRHFAPTVAPAAAAPAAAVPLTKIDGAPSSTSQRDASETNGGAAALVEASALIAANGTTRCSCGDVGERRRSAAGKGKLLSLKHARLASSAGLPPTEIFFFREENFLTGSRAAAGRGPGRRKVPTRMACVRCDARRWRACFILSLIVGRLTYRSPYNTNPPPLLLQYTSLPSRTRHRQRRTATRAAAETPSILPPAYLPQLQLAISSLVGKRDSSLVCHTTHHTPP